MDNVNSQKNVTFASCLDLARFAIHTALQKAEGSHRIPVLLSARHHMVSPELFVILPNFNGGAVESIIWAHTVKRNSKIIETILK